MTSTRSVDDFISAFPHTDVPKIKDEPTYSSLADLRAHLKTNAASIQTTRGGGSHGHLGLVVSAVIYTTIVPHDPYTIPANPGPLPVIIANATQHQIAEAVRQHTANLKEYTEFCNLHNALKKQIIKSVDPMYLQAIRNPHSAFLNVSLREMLAHLFDEYGDIAAQDLADNEARMKNEWNPAESFESLIKQIDDAQEYASDGNAAYTNTQLLNTAYNLVFNTGLFFEDCNKWDAKAQADKTWTHFKTHFRAAARLQRRQQRTSQKAGFHSANNVNVQQETAEALANLATAASADRQTFANLTNTVAKLTAQLAARDAELSDLKKNRPNNKPRNNDNGNYCWTHGYRVGKQHTGETCEHPAEGHQKAATRANTMGGSTAGKPN